MKSISIAMAAYNEAQNIETMICEVVDIMSRISFNYEFVIVNDGSTDETANIVKSVAERYPQVRLLTRSE